MSVVVLFVYHSFDCLSLTGFAPEPLYKIVFGNCVLTVCVHVGFSTTMTFNDSDSDIYFRFKDKCGLL